MYEVEDCWASHDVVEGCEDVGFHTLNLLNRYLLVTNLLINETHLQRVDILVFRCDEHGGDAEGVQVGWLQAA